ncbi:MAG: GAF domain-containing protein [Cytophagales bacterium]|nr:GAF domain-containing protein [Cytophagales bacterium]
MKNIYSLFRIGYDDSQSDYVTQQNYFTSNLIAWVILVLSVPFVISTLGMSLVIYPVLCMLVCILCLLLNHWKYNQMARLLVSTVGCVTGCLFHIALLSKDEPILTSIFTVTVALSTFPWILIRLKEKKAIITANLICSSAIFYQIGFGGISETEGLSAPFRSGPMYYIGLTIAFLLSIAASFCIRWINESISGENEKISRKIKKQNENLQASGEKMKDLIKTLEKKQEEEKDRQWLSSGLGSVNQILSPGTTIDQTKDKALSFIVKYTRSSVGALYEINDEQLIEMIACYACERKKHINKTLEAGEGLVGQAYLEQELIRLTEIPKGYMKINSSLGDDSPKELLVLPLLHNGQVEGVLELASLYAYTQQEIEFIKSAGPIFGAYLFNTQNTKRMARLLEETQEQAQQLREQDEEMRQNMEELLATQEQLSRDKEETE